MTVQVMQSTSLTASYELDRFQLKRQAVSHPNPPAHPQHPMDSREGVLNPGVAPQNTASLPSMAQTHWQSNRLVAPVRFMGASPALLPMSGESIYDTGSSYLLPDPLYSYLQAFPKGAMTHVHQGGSSDPSFVKYSYLDRIFGPGLPTYGEHKQAYIRVAQALDIPMDEDTTAEQVYREIRTRLGIPQVIPHKYENAFRERFRELSDDGASQPTIDDLSWKRVVRFMRVQNIQPDQEDLWFDEGEEITQDQIQRLAPQGLNFYRSTSKVIDPHVKNMAAAYLNAYLFAINAANDNVRYVEYRVSPESFRYDGPYDLEDMSKNRRTLEQILQPVVHGFMDAKQVLHKARKDFDFGIVVLAERQAPSWHKLEDQAAKSASGARATNFWETDDPQEAFEGAQEAAIAEAKKVFNEVITLKQNFKERAEYSTNVSIYDVGQHIRGVDLAGDERNYEASLFHEPFGMIAEYNRELAPDEQEYRLGITLHAGETPTSGYKDNQIGQTKEEGLENQKPGWKSIWNALDIAGVPYGTPADIETKGTMSYPVRLGHAAQFINSIPELREYFVNEYVQPEVSNNLSHRRMWDPGDLTESLDQKGAQIAKWYGEYVERAGGPKHALPPEEAIVKAYGIKNEAHADQLLAYLMWHRIRTYDIAIEMAPKSNIQTFAINPQLVNGDDSVKRVSEEMPYATWAYRYHPGVFLSRLGIPITISSDNNTISNSNITNEYAKLMEYLGATPDDLFDMAMASATHAFASPEMQEAIKADVERKRRELDNNPANLVGRYLAEQGITSPNETRDRNIEIEIDKIFKPQSIENGRWLEAKRLAWDVTPPQDQHVPIHTSRLDQFA